VAPSDPTHLYAHVAKVCTPISRPGDVVYKSPYAGNLDSVCNPPRRANHRDPQRPEDPSRVFVAAEGQPYGTERRARSPFHRRRTNFPRKFSTMDANPAPPISLSIPQLPANNLRGIGRRRRVARVESAAATPSSAPQRHFKSIDGEARAPPPRLTMSRRMVWPHSRCRLALRAERGLRPRWKHRKMRGSTVPMIRRNRGNWQTRPRASWPRSGRDGIGHRAGHP